MWVDDPLLIRPPDDAVIWRYMSLPRFIALLNDQELYFRRLDHFGDPFEGAFPRPNLPMLQKPLQQGQITFRDSDGSPGREATTEEYALCTSFGGVARVMRSMTFANCWHQNNHESAAMWDLYMKDGEGVAIRSTFMRLAHCWKPECRKQISIGMVHYLDYDTDEIPWTENGFNLRWVWYSKRMSFQHEQELRAVFTSPNRKPEQKGMSLPCDLGTLIERVYIAPTAPEWVVKVIRACAARFGLHVVPQQSRLMDGPLW